MSERNLSQIPGGWRVDVSIAQPGGKFKRLRASFPTKEEARGYLALVRSRKAARRLGIDVPEAKGADPLFKDFAERVILTGDLRPHTVKDREIGLRVILRSPLFAGRRLSEISVDDISAYVAERGAVARSSANAELTLLKMIFRRALQRGEIQRSPAAAVKPFRIPLTRLRILSDDEWTLLLSAAAAPIVPLLRLLVTSAMRPHEAFALHWARDGWDTERGLKTSILDLSRKLIFIPSALAKNHKDREVPLSPELVTMFEGLQLGAFTGGKVFGWTHCPKGFGQAVKAAGLKNVSLYVLRHTAASNWINKDRIDIVTVSELLGHSDIKMTMRYCHSNKDSKREAVERASRRIFKAAAPADAPTDPEARPLWARPNWN